jgi:hypothetical protein
MSADQISVARHLSVVMGAKISDHQPQSQRRPLVDRDQEDEEIRQAEALNPHSRTPADIVGESDP